MSLLCWALILNIEIILRFHCSFSVSSMSSLLACKGESNVSLFEAFSVLYYGWLLMISMKLRACLYGGRLSRLASKHFD